MGRGRPGREPGFHPPCRLEWVLLQASPFLKLPLGVQPRWKTSKEEQGMREQSCLPAASAGTQPPTHGMAGPRAGMLAGWQHSCGGGSPTGRGAALLWVVAACQPC